MVSVQLFNKNEYKASGELTECFSRSSRCPRLKPSPSFIITGLDLEKKYQVFLSFKQIEKFRKNNYQQLLHEPPLHFNKPNVEHTFGIASGKKFMEGTISFAGLKITNNIEAAGGLTIYVNSCHKYTPMLKIMESDSREAVNFVFDEASFRVVQNVTRATEKGMADEGDQENLMKRQCHNPASEVPVLTETKDTQPQVEGQYSPKVERQDSSSMNDQSLISVELANKNLYTNIDGLVECRVIKQPRFLKPSPVFLVTGLDREKNYRVFLSFKQTGNLRKQRRLMLSTERQEYFNEPNVEHKFGIASGEKIMNGTISFEGIKITSNIEDAGDQIVHLNSCHKYIPVLKIQEFDSQAAVNFFFDKASFTAVSCLTVKRTKEKRMTDEEGQENFQDQPDPQGHDEALLVGTPQDRFRADIQGQVQVHNQVHRQVPQGTVRLPFNAGVYSQHNQFTPQHQLGHPRAPQVPMYPQFPVQAFHAQHHFQVPHEPHYQIPQVSVHTSTQPPFNPNPMIPPQPGFNNPIPQYPYPPMHRPTMFPTQQYPHQFNHPSPHNPNFMPHPQMFPQHFPPGNTHPQYPYNGPYHSHQ